jgi:hypothetical protein
MDNPRSETNRVNGDKGRAIIKARYEQRYTEFARLRSKGVGIRRAAELVEIAVDTGYRYERRYKAERAAANG